MHKRTWSRFSRFGLIISGLFYVKLISCTAQCGTFSIYLSFRFYVKSILAYYFLKNVSRILSFKKVHFTDFCKKILTLNFVISTLCAILTYELLWLSQLKPVQFCFSHIHIRSSQNSQLKMIWKIGFLCKYNVELHWLLSNKLCKCYFQSFVFQHSIDCHFLVPEK